MLRLLREAGESLLDDEALLSTLNNSRSTSAAINTRVVEAQATEASINAARESYRPAAAAHPLCISSSPASPPSTQCALDAACICGKESFRGQTIELELHRYQTSLTHVVRLFNRCVETAPCAAALPDRLANIAASVTRAVFSTVQRGLFEEHKLIFAFLLGRWAAARMRRASRAGVGSAC